MQKVFVLEMSNTEKFIGVTDYGLQDLGKLLSDGWDVINSNSVLTYDKKEGYQCQITSQIIYILEKFESKPIVGDYGVCP